MYKIFSNYIILTLAFTFIVHINNAQEFSNSGLNVGVKFGGSRLLGEIKNDFSGVINEFDNKFGFASGLEISKYVSSRWEIGGKIDLSVLNGNTYSPEFSAEGFQPGIPAEIVEPVEYQNNLMGFKLFFSYFLKSADSESALIPFIQAGGGYLNYNSTFKFIDAPADDLLFGKGKEGYTKLSTPVFFLGTGLKTNISSNIYLKASVDFNAVNYDFLDVMHNYNTEGIRIGLTGLYTEFKLGIFYNFHKSEGNKKGGTSHGSSLPFAR